MKSAASSFSRRLRQTAQILPACWKARPRREPYYPALVRAPSLWLSLSLCLAAPVAAQDGSRSIGTPRHGRLVDGVHMSRSEHMVLLGSGGRWGTSELVGLLTRSAERLQRAERGPRLLVGDLSSRRGGHFAPHSSHQSGRDADVSLFYTDLDGGSVEPARFVELHRETGCGRDHGQTYCLDGRRTFLYLVALLEDEAARVQVVLIASDLRELVLAAGRRLDVTQETLDRVREITRPRQGSASHRSHLHVRIECPESDRPRCHR